MLQSAFAGFLKSSATAIAAAFQAERTQWLNWLPIALIIGITMYFSLEREPPLWLGPMAAMIMLGTVIAMRRGRLWIVCVILFLIMAGFALIQLRAAIIATPILQRPLGPVMVEGTIDDLDLREKGQRVTLENVTVADFPTAKTPVKIRLSLKKPLDDSFHIGDRLRLQAKLLPLTAPVVPGGYDFAVLQYFKQLGALGFAFGKPEHADTITSPTDSLFMETTRQHIATRVADNLAADRYGPSRAIVTALLTGEQNSIPESITDDLRASGLFHIISISGLHIAYVAMLVFFVVRRCLVFIPGLALHWPLKKIAACGAIVAITAYGLLVGAPTPTQRSVLMTSIVLCAVMLDRTALSMRLVAVAATLILILQPEQIYSISFQLSFAAVMGLIAAYETIVPNLNAWFLNQHWLIRLLKVPAELLSTSLVATLATLPFIIYAFQNSQFYGVFANMLGVPLTGFWIMPLGCLSFLLMPLHLDGGPMRLMAEGVNWLVKIAETVAAWPGAIVHFPAPTNLSLLLFTVGFLWLCLWQTRWRLWGLLPLLAGFVIMSFDAQQPDLLVAPLGKMIAARRDGGDYVLAGSTREHYYRDSWQQWLGAADMPDVSEAASDNFSCDDARCIYKKNNQQIILIKTAEIFDTSCADSNIVITIVRLPGFKGHCKHSQTIRYWDTADNGTYAFYANPNGFKIDTVNAHRGTRPWVAMGISNFAK